MPPAASLSLEAWPIHTDVERTGELRFGPSLTIAAKHGEGLLSAIHNATLNSALANLNSVPTDCPTRERRGYLGDSQIARDTMVSNFDMAGE